MSKIWKTGPTKVFKTIKPVVHYGFVPLIIYIAMKQEPQLTYVSFFSRCRHVRARWHSSVVYAVVLMADIHSCASACAMRDFSVCGRSFSHSRPLLTQCSCNRRRRAFPCARSDWVENEHESRHPSTQSPAIVAKSVWRENNENNGGLLFVLMGCSIGPSLLAWRACVHVTVQEIKQHAAAEPTVMYFMEEDKRSHRRLALPDSARVIL